MNMENKYDELSKMFKSTLEEYKILFECYERVFREKEFYSKRCIELEDENNELDYQLGFRINQMKNRYLMRLVDVRDSLLEIKEIKIGELIHDYDYDLKELYDLLTDVHFVVDNLIDEVSYYSEQIDELLSKRESDNK